jgi:hypothetical protein
MRKLKERYLVNSDGERVAVLLDIADYRRLLELAGQTAPTLESLPVAEAADIAEAMSIAGLGESKRPLISGKAVSEHPDLYLYGAHARRRTSQKPRAKNGRRRRG